MLLVLWWALYFRPPNCVCSLAMSKEELCRRCGHPYSEHEAGQGAALIFCRRLGSSMPWQGSPGEDEANVEEARRMESLWASFCFEDGVIESWFYGFIEISNCIDFQLFVFCLYLFMSCSIAQCIPSIPIHSINCSSGSSLASMCITCPSSFACIDCLSSAVLSFPAVFLGSVFFWLRFKRQVLSPSYESSPLQGSILLNLKFLSLPPIVLQFSKVGFVASECLKKVVSRPMQESSARTIVTVRVNFVFCLKLSKASKAMGKTCEATFEAAKIKKVTALSFQAEGLANTSDPMPSDGKLVLQWTLEVAVSTVYVRKEPSATSPPASLAILWRLPRHQHQSM